MASPSQLRMTRRPGRLQASVLKLLAEKPRSVEALHAELPAFRHDNVLRAVRLLRRQGFVDGDGDVLFCPNTEHATALAAASTGAPRNDFPKNEYTALTVAFLLLSQGSPCAADDLFPPHAVTRKFALRAIESLRRLALAEPDANGYYTIKDVQAFKDTWADERSFCSVLGRECSVEQASSMGVLLGGHGSLREDAGAAAALYETIGQGNTARRTGLPVMTVTALRRIASLPPEAQVAMEQGGLGARWILGLPAETPAAEIVARMERQLAFIENRAGTLAPGDSETSEDTDATPSDAELLATCLKLCAFTADTVARMERQLAFLASELGYRERE